MENKKNSDISIYIVMFIFVALFLAMMGYFAYYVQFSSPDDINNSYNPRQEKLAAKVIRGAILSSDRKPLACTELTPDGREIRRYPYGGIFAHVVGYSTKGRYGIESIANISLLTSNADISERISNEMADQKSIGDNIISTLDIELQKCAYETMGIYKGSIMVAEPKTGRILAMVSSPGFDPGTIDQQWDELNEMTTSPLMNRTTQGLYPPGSTFKMITLLEYFRENKNPEEYSFNCNGRFTAEDVTINCFHGSVHGKLDLKKSFAKSCNSSFANIGYGLKSNAFRSTAKDLLFNEELPIKLSHKMSSFTLEKSSNTEEKLHTAIGQGKTLVTPLHMNLITQAIANKGMLEKPCLIDRIENYKGVVIKQYHTEDEKRLMTSEEADFLTEYMEAVITEGTGSKLMSEDYYVAGKTGSAEYGQVKGDSHSWFTGFARDESGDKCIAVTVLVEGAGTGSDYAVPMAKRIFDCYYR